MSTAYDPFTRGGFPVGVRTFAALDAARERQYPCELWYPATAAYVGQDLDRATQDTFSVTGREAGRRQAAVRDAAAAPGKYPLILFSHGSAIGARRMASYLCTHLASHGYVVAALDHFELVATELAPKPDDSEERRTVRARAWLGNRVPDLRFLLDCMLADDMGTSLISRRPLPHAAPAEEMRDVPIRASGVLELDAERIGLVGYSFGGWTVLSAPAFEDRIRAVVALAPGGASRTKPGILPGTLSFDWHRDVPVLYLVAENDVMTPLDGMYELYERTPGRRQMVILRRADHIHFLDDAEREHEAARNMAWGGKLAWIPTEMRPIAELCSGDDAQLFVRGLTVAHLDAILKERQDAASFLAGDLEAALATRGVAVITYRP